jgi:excisionase family DNA binding protein
MPDDLYTTAEVAARLGVSVKTVTRWAVTGRLDPATKLPGTTGAYLFRPADVARLEQERAA